MEEWWTEERACDRAVSDSVVRNAESGAGEIMKARCRWP